MIVRVDPAAPYTVEEVDVPFARPGGARPEGKELLARIKRIALMRDVLGRQLPR